MGGKRFRGEVWKGVVATVVFFAIVEGLLRGVYFIRNMTVREIPLPYVLDSDYGPTPPWIDGLRILETDRALIWRSRPGLRRTYVDVFSPVHTEEERTSLLRQFLPSVPASLKGNPVWEIALNSQGFRNREFSRPKPASVFRILCLGDSWTFGANAGQEEAYPQRLEVLLRRAYPRASFEVLNLGVPGYSSFQGLELLKRDIDVLQPDMVAIGFGMNDSRVAGFRDKDMPGDTTPPHWTRRVSRLAEHIEAYKLLRYVALLLRHEPKAIGARLGKEGGSAGEKTNDEGERAMLSMYEENEAWTRVSPRDYEQNILEMILLARSRDAGAVLLFNELWQGNPYRSVLEGVSRRAGVPLVDASAIVATAKKKIEEGLEERLGLRPPTPTAGPASGTVEVVFRVYAGERAKPRGIFIVGNHAALGDRVPNRIAMYDDGTHGDQQAGDHVWSYAARLPAGKTFLYMYTNSGAEGKWEGLDVPEIRRFKVAADDGGDPVYRPIESFGRIYMQADSWHTNAQGYELIAHAVLEKLQEDEKFKRHVGRAVAKER